MSTRWTQAVLRKLNWFFWHKLCLCVDRPPSWHNTLRHKWNRFTGRIAGFLHGLHCEQCRDKRFRYKEVRDESP